MQISAPSPAVTEGHSPLHLAGHIQTSPKTDSCGLLNLRERLSVCGLCVVGAQSRESTSGPRLVGKCHAETWAGLGEPGGRPLLLLDVPK